jgi:hypothetical protein
MPETLANPFDTILQRIDQLESNLVSAGKVMPPEIIDRAELCKRLDITELTAIRWGKKGRLPFFRIGSAVRYNWIEVIKVLEK